MPKLLMAGPHPLQKTTPLSNISRGFSTCAQKPVLWTTLQSCFFAYLAFTKGAMCSAGASLSGLWSKCSSIHDSFSQCSQLCKTQEIPTKYCVAFSPHCTGYMMRSVQKCGSCPSFHYTN